ncbi:hypothetical protein [Winogradskyella algicola]|uniref:hypothetical protein n=1 Tax=Winogradskyella algicola TaxID=2575815 RepID=UPI0011085292|nr:hypothetical protein [Winogradskyella algicola]
MKRIIFFVIIICSIKITFAQTDINNYKYLIIPVQFEFKKGKNPLKLSTLTRYLFNKEGFTTYYEGDKLPDDLFKDRCLASYAQIVELKEGFRMTRLKILLKDCKDNIIFESVVGDSGENNHEKRYHEALREAFTSIESLNYNYKPEIEKNSNDYEQNNNVVSISEKPKSSEKVLNEEKIEETSEKTEVTLMDSELSADSNTEESNKYKNEEQSENIDIIFYAQEIENGFQLVDDVSNKIMVLLKTAKSNLFIVKGKDAIVYPENGKWIYSEATEKDYDSYPINIKF